METYEICRCFCHKFPEGTVKHAEPCCRTCPYCRERIRKDYVENHVKECRKATKRDGT